MIKMEEIEEKNPNLVNCIGNIDISSEKENQKCLECNFIYECYQIKKELEGDAFKPGKWRPGFGKPKGYVYER